MSKKSRKRNKKILAAIGIGLGAAALASKKRNTSIQANEAKESGFAESTKKPSIAEVSGPKKDTAVKTKTTIQDNKVDTGRKKSMAETSTVPKKRPGITVYDDGSIKAKDKGSGNFVDYANKEKYSNRLDTKPPGASGSTTSTGTTARGSNTFNDKIRANNEKIRSGTSLKSGGRVKGCGKALRGFGKAMKGKR
jgi:hypothetical protein